MTIQTLREILHFLDIPIEVERLGTGSRNLGGFYDIEAGTGQPIGRLAAAVESIRQAGHTDASVDRVDNPDHEDFGKPFLAVRSFYY
jgi:hypothetical protein